MDYLLKASAVILIFYLCYRLLLHKETFFQTNRWFLLFGLVLAIGLPFVSIPLYVETAPFEMFNYQPVSSFPINTNQAVDKSIVQPYDFMDILFGLYLAGVFIGIVKLTLNLLSLRRIIKSSQIFINGNIKIYKTGIDIAPFCFFKYIVFNPNHFQNEELPHILNHEKVHAFQLHSVDVLISYIACAIFWFNPIVWLYKKAIQQNLEFIADSGAQLHSESPKSYQKLLVRTAVKYNQLAVINTFYTSLIKKRIIMLHKAKSKAINQVKYLTALPLLVVFMMSFNTETIYVTQENTISDQSETFQDKAHTISAKTSEADLNRISNQFRTQGLVVEFLNTKRNADGEIFSLSIDFKKPDQKRFRTWNLNTKSNTTIQPISIMFEKNQFIVSSGRSFSKVFDLTKQDTDTKFKRSFLVQNDEKSSIHSEDSDDKIEEKGKIQTSKNSRTVTSFKLPDTLQKENGVLKQMDSSYFDLQRRNSSFFSSDGTKPKMIKSQHDLTDINYNLGENFLVIVDGLESTIEVIQLINPKNIKSMDVLEPEKAKAIYGIKATDGALILRTKNYLVSVDSLTKDEIVVYRDIDGKFVISGRNSNIIFIVDGKEVTRSTLNALPKDSFKSVETLSGVLAVERYGAKASSGAVVINTIPQKGWYIGSEKVITEKEYSYEKSNDQSTVEFIITKDVTDEFLDRQIKEMANNDLRVSFKRIKRNREGSITGIKITISDANGKESSASWKSSSDPIPDIVLGKSKNGSLILRALE